MTPAAFIGLAAPAPHRATEAIDAHNHDIAMAGKIKRWKPDVRLRPHFNAADATLGQTQQFRLIF
jgi:hypothetical protein